MRIVASIEARMRSTRLPGKVLKPILGKPMMERMIERVRQSRYVNDIVVATTEHESCDCIEQLAEELGVFCYRGSEEDVLARVSEALVYAGADVAVILTGDMPVADPQLIDKVVEAFLESKADYCANSLIQTYPRGLGVQVMPTALLVQSAKTATSIEHREHATLYLREHPDLFRHVNISSGLPPEVAAYRLTVDTPEDYELITKIYEALYPKNPAFSLEDILKLFASHPELPRINAAVRQKSVR